MKFNKVSVEAQGCILIVLTRLPALRPDEEIGLRLRLASAAGGSISPAVRQVRLELLQEPARAVYESNVIKDLVWRRESGALQCVIDNAFPRSHRQSLPLGDYRIRIVVTMEDGTVLTLPAPLMRVVESYDVPPDVSPNDAAPVWPPPLFLPENPIRAKEGDE